MRKIVILFFSALFLWGVTVPVTQVQMLASHVERDGDVIKADGDVVFYYQDKILQADRAIYDTKNAIVKLYGHVTLLKGLEYVMLSDYVFLDLKKEQDLATRFFMADLQSELWLRGGSSEKIKDVMKLQKALLSSCSVTCPDWHIAFSSAKYNEKTQWLDIWNPRFYAGKVPVFYLPYIGTSLNRERRSGLLRPSIGYSGKDGFAYAQSLYIAVDPQWDLEFTPQFRAKRGAGMYATFRFVDTDHSYGYVRGGYFKTKQSYMDEYDLKNESQYGLQLHYENKAPFFGHSDRYDDGFYADVTYLNDPDYLNLQSVLSSSYYHSSQVMSRLNYFINSENNYAGLYGRYYIDTRYDRDGQKDVFQSAPMVQLHHYQSTLLNLGFAQYAFDYRYNHYFTESGKHIHFHEASLPVSAYGSFLNDFLKVAAVENLYYAYSGYTNMEDSLTEQEIYDDHYTTLRDYQTLSLYTDLAKPYGDHFHTMQLRATYTHPGFENDSGRAVDNVQVLLMPRENLSLNMINYLYDGSGENMLYYRIAQPIFLEDIDGYSDTDWGDLEQEIRFALTKNLQLYTNLFYNYDASDLSSASSYIKLEYPRFALSLNHLYKQRLQKDESMTTTSNFFSANASYRFEEGHTLYGSISYDKLSDEVSRWGIGTHFYRRCWDLDIGIRDEIQPILNSAGGADNIHNVMVYFTINIVPFGAFSYALQAAGQDGSRL